MMGRWGRARATISSWVLAVLAQPGSARQSRAINKTVVLRILFAPLAPTKGAFSHRTPRLDGCQDAGAKKKNFPLTWSGLQGVRWKKDGLELAGRPVERRERL